LTGRARPSPMRRRQLGFAVDDAAIGKGSFLPRSF
jgi:hypothetical protein